MHYDPVSRTLSENCFRQEFGISSANSCKIAGFSNKCDAGSTIDYAGIKNSIDARILCPLDSVAQSDWIDGSQKGLCTCEAALLDEACNILEEVMDCECFACPSGFTLGFAYSCSTEIVGPCKSFDCNGRCNEKFDPGNLVGDKETFPPTVIDEPSQIDPNSSAGNRIDMSNNYVMGTAVMIFAFLRMIV